MITNRPNNIKIQILSDDMLNKNTNAKILRLIDMLKDKIETYSSFRIIKWRISLRI